MHRIDMVTYSLYCTWINLPSSLELGEGGRGRAEYSFSFLGEGVTCEGDCVPFT